MWCIPVFHVLHKLVSITEVEIPPILPIMTAKQGSRAKEKTGTETVYFMCVPIQTSHLQFLTYTNLYGS